MSEWKEYKLSDVCLKIGSGATPRGGQESYLSHGEYSLIRSQNVLDFDFTMKGLAYINEAQASKLNNVEIKERDILLNITGDSVARVCQVQSKILPARVNQHVSIIRPKKESINSFFLNLLLTSKPYKDQLLFTGEQGATRQAITKAQIESFRISIPNLKRQKTIVKQLDALKKETQKLVLHYNKKIDELDELKKSILSKAFDGEL